MKQHLEIERRWLVLEIDHKIHSLPGVIIDQAYFSMADGLRVRIIPTNSELTIKTGHGISRIEKTVDISLEAARLLVESTPFTITKLRRSLRGWDIDFFQKELLGVIVAEFEMTSPDQPMVLPPEISSAIEVTSIISSRHLAQIAYDLRATTREQRSCGKLLPSFTKTYEIIDHIVRLIKGSPDENNLGSILRHYQFCDYLVRGLKEGPLMR